MASATFATWPRWFPPSTTRATVPRALYLREGRAHRAVAAHKRRKQREKAGDEFARRPGGAARQGDLGANPPQLSALHQRLRRFRALRETPGGGGPEKASAVECDATSSAVQSQKR